MDQNIIERHRRFWRGDNSAPLLAHLPHPGWSRKPYPLSRDRYAVEPRRIDPDDIDIDKLLGADRLSEVVNTGDYIHGVKPMYPVACMESIIGCPVYAADTSCYSRPFDSLPANVTTAPKADWVRMLDTLLQREVELAGERLPALQLHFRGIVDMVAAYWGEERMCLAMFDDPASLHALSAEFADTFLEMARNGIRMRPAWFGGYVSHWGVYAPGPLLDYQVDATSILSRTQYDEFFLDVDEKLVAFFPYSVIHLHACGLHIAPSIATIAPAPDESGCRRDDSSLQGGRAVEINLDRECGVLQIDEIIRATRALQEQNVRVILNGELLDAEIEVISESLDPGGLAIFSWRPRSE